MDNSALFGRYVTRTRDPHNVDVMRYQLRQPPIFIKLFLPNDALPLSQNVTFSHLLLGRVLITTN